MHPYLNIGIKAARAAGKIIVNAYLHPNSFLVNQKTSQMDLVTNVDKECEKAILEIIHKAYPDHNIVAEESGEKFNGSDFTWCIDPLDGTFNFVHSYPGFAVSVALLSKEGVEHAIIYDPIADELFTASKGMGARVNNQRLRVSDTTELSGSLVVVPHQYKLDAKDYNCRYLGSAALQLAYLAAGRVDAYCECGLRIWDIAAGILLVREAGGKITDLTGGQDFLQNGQIVAATHKIHTKFLATIQKNNIADNIGG